MITSGFFNSIDGDRRYRAEDFANYFNSIVSTGVFEDTIGNLSVSPSSGMSVAVAPGKAFINGYCMISSSAVSMTIPAAHASLDRIDRIAVRLDLAGRAMNIVLLSGTPSGTATPPELTRNSSRYELCLADISIPAGTTAITSALITDTRADSELCGGVYVRTADQLVLEGKADKEEVDNLSTVVNGMLDTVEKLDNAIYEFSPFKNQKAFTSSGAWVCPEGVTKVSAWLVNGGDGSDSACYYNNSALNGRFYLGVGAAKRGQMALVRNIDVVPGQTYSVIVGAGGGAGINAEQHSSNNVTKRNKGGIGGVSSFDSVKTTDAVAVEKSVSESVVVLNGFHTTNTNLAPYPEYESIKDTINPLVTALKLTADGINVFCPIDPSGVKENAGLGGLGDKKTGFPDVINGDYARGTSLTIFGKSGSPGRVVIYY